MSQMTGGGATVSTEYIAGLMSQSFWFIEFKKMVPPVFNGMSNEDLNEECLEKLFLVRQKNIVQNACMDI